MRLNALCRASLVLLYGGVAPLDPVKDACEKAALHVPPSTEREWQAITFDVQDLRVRRRGDERWIEVHDAQWDADGLSMASRPGARGGTEVAEAVGIQWNEIERIDKPVGRRTALGAGVGALVGLGFGIGLGASTDCSGAPGCGMGFLVLPVFTVPIGTAVGALMGSTVRKWTPFFCATSPIGEEQPVENRE